MEERRHTAAETVRRGKEIYEKSIREEVEAFTTAVSSWWT